MNGAVSSDANPSDVQGVCPDGWHLPSDVEWKELEMYLGTDVGGKLKESGTSHWNSPNTGATNESRFTALLGGFHRPDTLFYGISTDALFWSATDYANGGPYGVGRLLQRGHARVIDGGWYKNSGMSIRCVKD